MRFLLLLFILILPTVIQAFEWQIVPNKSSIHFKAIQNHSPVTGEFKIFSGHINFDKNKLNESHVSITIDISSVSTSFKVVSDTLKTTDWFDITAFPQAHFTAKDFKQVGNNRYEANGQLTIRDKTAPIVVYFTLEKYTDHDALISGSAQLKRTNFEVGKGEWASTKEIKDAVAVSFVITATQKTGLEKK